MKTDTASGGMSGNGHRRRLREKFLQAGGKGFLDYELLELLLTFSIPRRDTKKQAKELLARHRSLPGILDAPIQDLLKNSGIGESSALLIKLARSLMVRYLEEEIRGESYMGSSDKFCDFARARLGEYADEVMMVFYLNTKNMLIDTEIVSEGTTDSVMIFPAAVARRALLHSAKAVILCHNHPSGVVTPSPEDNAVTREVRKVLDPLKILLLDHIVVSKYDYYSYRYADTRRVPSMRLLPPLLEERGK